VKVDGVCVQGERAKEVYTRQARGWYISTNDSLFEDTARALYLSQIQRQRTPQVLVSSIVKNSSEKHNLGTQSTLSRRFCHQDQNPAYNIYRLPIRSSAPLFLGYLCSSHAMRSLGPCLRLQTDHHRVHSNLNEQKLGHFGWLSPLPLSAAVNLGFLDFGESLPPPMVSFVSSPPSASLIALGTYSWRSPNCVPATSDLKLDLTAFAQGIVIEKDMENIQFVLSES